jgi:hypothetical protein
MESRGPIRDDRHHAPSSNSEKEKAHAFQEKTRA